MDIDKFLDSTPAVSATAILKALGEIQATLKVINRNQQELYDAFDTLAGATTHRSLYDLRREASQQRYEREDRLYRMSGPARPYGDSSKVI